MDDIDRRIIELVSDNARISNAELANSAGVAPSTSHTRLRALVESGAIRGFHADVSRRQLGLGIEALVSVTIRVGARHTIVAFLDHLRALPEVVQAFFLGGSEDFIVHIAVRDSDAVRDFVVDNLSANQMVASTRTSMVFEHHIAQFRMPADPAQR